MKPEHHRWLVVATTVLNQAVVVGISLYCFAIFSIPWLAQFEISRGELMLAVTALMIANGVAAPIVGPRLDRISLLWPVIIGYALFVTGLIVLSVASAYWQVILVYSTLFAVGQVLVGTFVSLMLVNRWFTARSGLAVGISATGTSIGGVVFPLLVAEALSSFSLASVLQSVAVFAVVILMPVNVLVLRVQPPARRETSGTDSNTPETAPTLTTKEVLSARAFWIPMIALLSVSTSFVAIQSNLGVHLNDLGHPASFTGQMIAVIAATMVVGKLMFGRLADSVDHVYLLLLMGGASVGAIAVLMTSSTEIPLLAAAVLLGCASGGLIPMMGVVFPARFGGASFGKVMGLAMLVMVLGSLGSVYAAWAYDLLGDYRYAFVSFIVMTIPAMLLLRWLPPALSVSGPAPER